MTESVPWHQLWEEVDAALVRYDTRLAKGTGAFLTDIRLAVTKYGRTVDVKAFDEYGQPIEAEEG